MPVHYIMIVDNFSVGQVAQVFFLVCSVDLVENDKKQ